jgi:DNA-binding NtrC family response regulator
MEGATVTDRLRILLVDADPAARKALTASLARLGDEVDGAADGVEAVSRLGSFPYDLVLAEVSTPKLDGLGLTDVLRGRNLEALMVLMSAHTTVEAVVGFLRAGVFDFLLKPVEPASLSAMLDRARERRVQRKRVRALSEALTARERASGLVVGGPAMTGVLEDARRAGACDLPVLLLGEPGTGKERIARSIHAMSDRASGPFERVDGNGDTLTVEYELFGAGGDEGGRWARARGGTLLVEDVASLSPTIQARLVRALELSSGEVRVLATASEPLDRLRQEGRLRNDLYFSLRAIELRVPALRERREDIPKLVEHFLADESRLRGRALRMAPDAQAVLMGVAWPGNVRELEGVVRMAAAQVAEGDLVQLQHLPATLQNMVPRTSTLAEQIEAYERTVIRQTLEALGGRVGQVAQALGVPERTLRRKMRAWGYAKEAFRKKRRKLRVRPRIDVPEASSV